MTFDSTWSYNYFTFSHNNKTAHFNQPSTHVVPGLDYNLYPCARLSTSFQGPFRVAITFSGYAWFGVGLPTTEPHGFEPYKSRAWMANTALEYFILNSNAVFSWVNFFGKDLNLKRLRLSFQGGYIANQMVIITIHPQDKWMLVTANTLQARFELQDLPADTYNTGYYFMISMSQGTAELHHAGPVTVSPAPLLPTQLSSQWSCTRHLASKHHFFISYRVASESALAHKLFGLLELHRPGTITTFLDANCLPHAIDWQESFERGLRHSRIIILLISMASLEKIKTNAPQYRDNVLLEMEHAIIRKRTEPEGTLAVFPVFVGTNPTVNINGVDMSTYLRFQFPYASSFPAVPHARGFALQGAPATIRETIEQVLQLNGVGIDPQDTKLFELLHTLFLKLDIVNAARKEFLLDPCSL